MFFSKGTKIYVHGSQMPYTVLWEPYRNMVIGHRDQGFLKSFIIIDMNINMCVVGSLVTLVKDKSEQNYQTVIDDIREGVMRLKPEMVVSTDIMIDKIVY